MLKPLKKTSFQQLLAAFEIINLNFKPTPKNKRSQKLSISIYTGLYVKILIMTIVAWALVYAA